MAKIKKLNSERKNDNSQEDLSFDDFLTMLQQELGIETDSLMDDEPEEADNGHSATGSCASRHFFLPDCNISVPICRRKSLPKAPDSPSRCSVVPRRW